MFQLLLLFLLELVVRFSVRSRPPFSIKGRYHTPRPWGAAVV